VGDQLASTVKGAGVSSLLTSGALAAIKAALEDAKNANAREGALLAVASLAESLGKPAEPYLMPLLANALAALADKQAPVRDAAAKAQEALANLLTPYGVSAVLPILFEGMLAQKWQTNEGACKLLASMADRAPSQTAVCLPEIVPNAVEAMGNAREAVKKAAAEAMTKCMKVVGNRDLDQFIPILIDCMQNPTKVPDTVHKLAATTFVQTVEAPTLSIMVPLLVRGLRADNTTAIKRKAAVIIENMAKLVDNPQVGVACWEEEEGGGGGRRGGGWAGLGADLWCCDWQEAQQAEQGSENGGWQQLAGKRRQPGTWSCSRHSSRASSRGRHRDSSSTVAGVVSSCQGNVCRLCLLMLASS
jgi:hypothetical protein